MDNQKDNLLQQPSESPKQALAQSKLWPINWRHNKALKLIGLLCFIVFFIDLLLLLFILFFPIGESGAAGGLALAVVIFYSSPILLFAIIHIIFSFSKFRTLDKTDKIFLTVSLLFFVAFLVLISRLPFFGIKVFYD